MLMAVMDSHRQAAFWVATGTWTRVQLTYRKQQRPDMSMCTPLFAVSHVFLYLSLSLSCPTVNTDTETAVVNVTYATKEEAKV